MLISIIIIIIPQSNCHGSCLRTYKTSDVKQSKDMASPGAVSDNNQEAMVLECSITINYSKTPKFPLLGEEYYRQFDGSTASKSSYYYYYYYVLIITGAYWYKNKCVQNTGTEEKLRSTRSVSIYTKTTICCNNS